jgi:hypothetical protein
VLIVISGLTFEISTPGLRRTKDNQNMPKYGSGSIYLRGKTWRIKGPGIKNQSAETADKRQAQATLKMKLAEAVRDGNAERNPPLLPIYSNYSNSCSAIIGTGKNARLDSLRSRSGSTSCQRLEVSV